jgi:hypothetical protein
MSDITIIGDSNDIFVVVGGVKIAKRGHTGTPEAGTWIPLKAGWTVTEKPRRLLRGATETSVLIG